MKIHSGMWARKPGETYVKKFQQLEASARYYDNTEHDSNKSDGVVIMGDESSKSTVVLAPGSTLAQISSEYSHYDGEFGGSNYETQYRQSTSFKQVNSTTLQVDESSYAAEVKMFNWDDSPVTDPIQDENSESRSFLVDIPSGTFLTRDHQGWFLGE